MQKDVTGDVTSFDILDSKDQDIANAIMNSKPAHSVVTSVEDESGKMYCEKNRFVLLICVLFFSLPLSPSLSLCIFLSYFSVYVCGFALLLDLLNQNQAL